MKKLLNRLVCVSFLSILLIGAARQNVQAQDVSVSYQSFYDNLAPYGQWVSDQQYGNVWVPNEGGDFRPYGTRGHWAMTDYGNTWVSDDPWGWACYHYGRWTYDQYYGWVWIPGYEWAPAWVSWRYGGGYSGWAPLGPNVSIGASYNCPESWWVFVQPQYMYHDNCISYWRGPSYNAGYIRECGYANNVYVDNGTHVRYNYGPRAEVIERDSHQPVQVYHVQRSNAPGAPRVSGNTVSIYRPAVNRATASTARPSNVMNAPRQIGRPQAATNVSATHQAPFRQQVQNNGRPGNNTNTPQPGRQQPANNQPGRQPNTQPAQQHQQPAQQQPRQQQVQQQHQQPAPQQQQPRQQQVQQQHQQPAPQHQQPRQQQQHQQPAPQQQQPRQQMQQQHQQPAPQQQQPRQQMQQQHQQPAPQQQQPRQQPMQQQPQQHMQAPQPQRQAPQQHEEPREGGRR